MRLPVTRLKGVGPRVAEKLQKLGIEYIEDLLFHLPFRYEDRTNIIPIGSLRPGESVVIQGQVELSEIKFARKPTLPIPSRRRPAMIFPLSTAQFQRLLAWTWRQVLTAVKATSII